ncbi:hypothetical protein C8R43DRAFT_1201982 [Mycena crocata]|nr:hypothetical protein C8R43DRAFT_1201982 [Mycena crocata]
MDEGRVEHGGREGRRKEIECATGIMSDESRWEKGRRDWENETETVEFDMHMARHMVADINLSAKVTMGIRVRISRFSTLIRPAQQQTSRKDREEQRTAPSRQRRWRRQPCLFWVAVKARNRKNKSIQLTMSGREALRGGRSNERVRTNTNDERQDAWSGLAEVNKGGTLQESCQLDVNTEWGLNDGQGRVNSCDKPPPQVSERPEFKLDKSCRQIVFRSQQDLMMTAAGLLRRPRPSRCLPTVPGAGVDEAYRAGLQPKSCNAYNARGHEVRKQGRDERDGTST